MEHKITSTRTAYRLIQVYDAACRMLLRAVQMPEDGTDDPTGLGASLDNVEHIHEAILAIRAAVRKETR